MNRKHSPVVSLIDCCCTFCSILILLYMYSMHTRNALHARVHIVYKENPLCWCGIYLFTVFILFYLFTIRDRLFMIYNDDDDSDHDVRYAIRLLSSTYWWYTSCFACSGGASRGAIIFHISIVFFLPARILVGPFGTCPTHTV